MHKYIDLKNHLATPVFIEDKFRQKTLVPTKDSERNILTFKQKYCIIERSQNGLKR